MALHKVVKAFALVAAVIFTAASVRAETITLKLSHFVPPQHAFHKWVVEWTQKIEKESGGRLKFEIYPNGQLVGPPNRQFDAARNGITDIAFCLHGVTPGRYPMTELANLPFTWPSSGVDLAEMGKRMTELAPKYLAAEHTGLHILFMSMANPVVLWSKAPINSVADYKGKKIRYASITNKQLLEAMGAVALLIPPQESQDALAKGIAEGATFPFEAGFAYDLGSVVPTMRSNRHGFSDLRAGHESGQVQLAAAGPARHPRQGEPASTGAMSFGKAWQDFEKFARGTFEKKGLKIITLPDSEVAKMKALAKPIIENALAAQEKAGHKAREFFAAYTK